MGKGKDKAGKKRGGQTNQGDKTKERSERARLRKDRQRNSPQSQYCSDADDREFEAQVRQIGCKIKFIAGDGNCLFRTLADQLEGRPQDHASVRAKIMDHLERNRDMFEPYMEDDEPFGVYLGRMRGDAEWGGNQELVAASQLYKTNVVVHQFKAPRFFIPFEKARLTIHLSYHGDYHYNSVRAVGDDGGGPALPITLQTPTSERGRDGPPAKGAGSPWPDQEEALARSCPWASASNIVQVLESTGGRGEDAIELLIAARNEPALKDSAVKDSACGGDNGDADGASTTPHTDTTNSGKTSPRGSGGSEGGNCDGKGAGLSNGNVSKSEASSPATVAAATATKAAKKVARASDCPCGSGLKYKKCCRKKDAAIARGQIAAPDPKTLKAATADVSSLANDLGSLVI